MSGGHFDYMQFHINEMANEIEMIRIEEHSYSKEVNDKLTQAVMALRIAYVYAQRVDWLLSGDDGEESFLESLKEDLDKLNK